ncbi:hypothetical protein [Bacillus thuringiensis]|uniref:hypothetical protein n=1 Tax=Bacillus thuringiensis TaxID=1428 RepID=UPI000BF6400E|nr:hypothetical protein [Bacillus thuringiensis]PEY76290.1 hypothetical protein CN355_02905 [Bacillus thuringiensis]
MKNLTVESALKVNYMKELVMLTELERQLQRGNIDYWVFEDCGKVGLSVTTKTWEDMMGISISIKHEDMQSFYLVESFAMDNIDWELIELETTTFATMSEAHQEVERIIQHLPEVVEQSLLKNDEDAEYVAEIREVFQDIADEQPEGIAFR